MQPNLVQIISHHQNIGGTFFTDGLMARRGDKIKNFKIIYHGKRVFLYAPRTIHRCINGRMFTVVEYEPDNGKIRSVAPGGIVFKSAAMIKKYLSILPLEQPRNLGQKTS